MKLLIDEFKKFILKGNVIELAVGVMIAASFATVVKAFADGIITPLLGAIGGSPGVSLHLWVLDVGLLFNAVIQFVINAAIIFFCIVKPMNVLLARMRKKDAEALPPPVAAEILLLSEIRDLLKKS